jgi:F-type H+-transporting ATPase subunit delta
MSITRIAVRYAQSLYDIAKTNNVLENVVVDIRNLNKIVAESKDFNYFLQSPLIAKDKKRESLRLIFESFQKDTLNLFLLMTEKNREMYISQMGTQFIQLYNKSHSITEALVTSASALEKDSLSQIEKYIKAQTGANSVNIETRTNTDLIGGLTIMFDGKIYDSSISSQIKKIKKELKIA